MEAEGAAAENGGAGKESGSRFRRVCVFCGSSSGKRSSYRDAAVELGKERVARKVDLVYGGPCHWRHTHHSHGQAGGPAERGRVLRLPAGVHRQGGGRRLHQALPAPHLRQRPRRQGTRPQAGGALDEPREERDVGAKPEDGVWRIYPEDGRTKRVLGPKTSPGQCKLTELTCVGS
ncbi:uncharacterized protein [Miscanthus floridulus]|uniref:uncharacterized protein isoform X2 n=1 Tax=Miscanthus floridulus TaxID=154761 RepID=UPI003459DCD2